MDTKVAANRYGKRMQPKPGRMTENKPRISEVHILWITAGLGCDGDSVSITAATQPSIEDVMLGAIPGLPKVHLHNPVLAYEVGDDFMKPFHQAARGELDALRPGRRRLDPQREDQRRRATGRRWAPIPRPASRSPPTSGSTGWRPRRWPSSPPAPARPTAASTPWRAIRPAAWAWPTISAGTGNRRPACRSSTCRAVRSSRTTSWRRCSTCSTRLAGLAPMIPLDDSCRPPGCSARPSTRAATAPATTSRATSPPSTARPSASSSSAAGARSFNATSPSAAGWPASAAAPTSAASASAAPCPASPTSSCRSWTSRRARACRRTLIEPYGRLIRALRPLTHATVNKEPKWRHTGSELTTGYHPPN